MAELSLADMAAVWRRDLVTNVIPFWEKHSLDREHGGYFTCCDRDGKILDDSKYMWLQARAVFMWYLARPLALGRPRTGRPPRPSSGSGCERADFGARFSGLTCFLGA